MKQTFKEVMQELEEKRRREGLSYEDLSKRTGYNRQTVYNILNYKAGVFTKLEVIEKSLNLM